MRFPANAGGDIELLPEGTYTGICTVIADLGLQPGSQQFPTPKQKVWFQWEVIGETVDIGGNAMPRVISQEYTASMGTKSNLRPAIEAWRGKAFKDDSEAEQFDIATLLGKPCLLTAKHSKNGKYTNVGAVMALPRGTPAPKGEIVPFLYDTEHDGDYDKLPKFIRDKIDNQLTAPPPKSAAKPAAGGGQFADDDDEELRKLDDALADKTPI